MIIQKVRSDTGDVEGKWVGLIIVAILIFATIAIPFHQSEKEAQTVLDHQILITDVKQENLAMIAELRLAHEEIRDVFKDDGEQWPSIEQLEMDWVAPFVKDQSWQRKGKHNWLMLDEGVYVGLTTQEHVASSILLNSNTSSPDIWVMLKNHSTNIAELNPEKLDSLGWTQVVMASDHESDKDTH